MKTLLLGDLKQMEDLYPWFQLSDEVFEIDMIISENRMVSEIFSCDIKPIQALADMPLDYDLFFICSAAKTQWKEMLSVSGVDDKKIKYAYQICEYLTLENRMRYYREDIAQYRNMGGFGEQITVGAFTYGNPKILFLDSGKKVTIKKFCSIADNVQIFAGGNHRYDWCTTYPFERLIKEFVPLEHFNGSNGDVVIGNDVWIGSDVKIMSGVTVGDGAVIAANAVVTKDVEPYTLVGGVPAKKIKDRFSHDIIEKMLEIKWWDWADELIYKAIPLLQSNAYEELFDFYEKNVK